MELRERIIDTLKRGPMLLREIEATVGVAGELLAEELTKLVKEGLIRRRKSNGCWIYWLGGDGRLSLRDWEMVEGLTVLQVLEEASKLT